MCVLERVSLTEKSRKATVTVAMVWSMKIFWSYNSLTSLGMTQQLPSLGGIQCQRLHFCRSDQETASWQSLHRGGKREEDILETCSTRSESAKAQLALLQLQEKQAKQQLCGPVALFELSVWKKRCGCWHIQEAPEDWRFSALDWVCTSLWPAVISFMSQSTLYSVNGCPTLAANISGLFWLRNQHLYISGSGLNFHQCAKGSEQSLKNIIWFVRTVFFLRWFTALSEGVKCILDRITAMSHWTAH